MEWSTIQACPSLVFFFDFFLFFGWLVGCFLLVFLLLLFVCLFDKGDIEGIGSEKICQDNFIQIPHRGYMNSVTKS